jgi:chitinase
MPKTVCLSFIIVFIGITFVKAQIPQPALVGYYQTTWGADIRLTDIHSNYNVVMLSFLEANNADQNPQNNDVANLHFSATNEAQLKEDIITVQHKGKKVLLSIGGSNGSFKLNSADECKIMVEKVQQYISRYHVDGIDIDLEDPVYVSQVHGGTITEPEPHIALLISGIQELLAWYRVTYGKKMLLTVAPEVAYTVGGLSDYMSKHYGISYLAFIEKLRNEIDLVMVQLYNASGGSFGLDGKVYLQGTPDFILSQTEAMILGFDCVNQKGKFSGLKPEQIAICLPADPSSVSYIAPDVLYSTLNYLRGVGSRPGNYELRNAKAYPNLGGFATWSINEDFEKGNYSIAQHFNLFFSNLLQKENK